LADDYTLGRDAYIEQKYDTALSLWLPLAEAGDMRAQFSLGALYYEGAGVEQDYEVSAGWFRAAADQGFAPAQFNLGNAYKHGQGVAQSDIEATKWWRLAAEQGFAPAQFNIGTQYYFGRGVPEDQEEGLRWYRRAATNGHERARQLLETAQLSVSPDGDPDGPGLDLKREEWILGQDPEHFVVQLAAVREESRVQLFIDQNDLRGELAYFRFLRDGATWYALIYGVFADTAAAKTSIASLPEKLRNDSPWIRKLATVQALILAAQ
jgi:TPR repeat protein